MEAQSKYRRRAVKGKEEGEKGGMKTPDSDANFLVSQLRAELLAKDKEIESLKKKLANQKPFMELEAAFAQIQNFLFFSPVSVYFKDTNFKYTYVNQLFSAWLNSPSDEVIGKSNEQLGVSDYLKDLLEIEKEAFRLNKIIREKEVVFQQGSDRFLLTAYVFPMQNAKGKAEGVMVCFIDHSERLQFKKELKQAKEEAAMGVKSKQTFLANLSHEIRTPLHGILGSSALLKNSISNDEGQELLANIQASGSALLDMLNAMLLLESVERGKWTVHTELFHLRSLIQDVSDKYSDAASQKAVDLQFFLAQGLPEKFFGDAEKIKRVLDILMSNALKFTSKGFVHLYVQAEKHNGKNTRLRFSVKDTGLGIKKELQPDLFNFFMQGDSSSTKNYQGTGIGLTMAQKTIAYLGGEIGFESSEFKGSTFWFVVDLENLTPDNMEPLTPAQLPVLLVEDNKINQKIAFFTLKKLGFPVEIAENGMEAIDRFQNGSFRIVLMDLQMPIMNGFDSSEKIRAFEKSKKRKPALIIALSANTVKEDIERCFVVGMNEYISKPFTSEKLIEVIQRFENIRI